MAVEACVTEILCGLGNAAVGAISGVLQDQLTAAEAGLGLVKAQILQLDVLLAPLTAVQGVAVGTLEQIEGYAQLVPNSIMADCVGLGDLNLGLVQIVEPVTDQVRAFLDKVTRALSFKDELEDLERTLQAQVDALRDIIAALALC